MELPFLALLIVLNGVFAMSEIAIVTSRRLRLKGLSETHPGAGKIALKLHADPTGFLSTVQVGITSIGVLNGILGEAVLAEPIALWLQHRGFSVPGSQVLATTLVVVLLTYATIVIGELVPKRIAQFSPERLALLVARPMRVLALLTYPFVRLLSISTDAILRLLPLGNMEPELTEEEIQAMVEKGSQTGVLHHQENQLVRNVFRLDDRLLKSLMTHRNDIVCLDLQNSPEANMEIISNSTHTLFPLCNGGLHHIVGIVNSKNLLLSGRETGGIDLHNGIQPTVFLPDTLTGMDLLNHFSVSRSKLALVVNEYGEVQGLVTAQDVLKTLVGEITEAEITEKAIRQGEDRWLLDGLIALPELKDLLGWKSVPEEPKANYHTLSGLMMQLLTHLPEQGERTVWEGWELQVLQMDDKRVDKVMARRLPRSAEELEEEED